MPQTSASTSSQCNWSVYCRRCNPVSNCSAAVSPPPSTESAPGGDCRASCAGPCAPRARPFPSPRRGCERWLPRAGNAAATHPGRCGRRRAKAATCKESATLYVAKRRANKPILPQASCRPQGSPGSGPGQLELPRPLLASEAVPSEDAGFLSHVHTDRPLGRPRGPLLQQHVGLLVVQRTAQAATLLDLVCRRQLLPPAVDYLKA
jgi:hypothetical protein